MAFGQQSGPPASSKQVQELLALLLDAGHDDFRDARGPMGFTQRQAAGKFTRDEADELIARLQAASADSRDGDSAGADGADSGGAGSVAPSRPAPAGTSATEKALRKASAQQLAAELQSRGWVVMEP